MSRSSGRTCVARASVFPALFLLVVMAVPTQAASAATDASSAAAISSTPLLLGYGATSMFPLSEGIPVYTVGETVWVETASSVSSAVSLESPTGDTVVGAEALEPQTITPLYTFSSSSQEGDWNLTVHSASPVTIPIHMVDLKDHPVSLGSPSYSLDGGNLSISSQASLGDSYDQQVCTTGPIANAGVALALPKDMNESGTMTLIPALSPVDPVQPVQLEVTGHVNETFTFWYELYYPYSLESPGTDTVVLDYLETASSVPITFLSAATVNSTLSWNMPTRDGRYELRAYFQNSTTLQVSQTDLLIVNGSPTWVSLSNDCNPETVQSQSVSYTANLVGGPSTWPDVMYLMYRTLGVEGVVSYPISPDLASSDFVVEPSGRILTNFTVDVSPTAGVQVGQSGDTMYVLASSYPVDIDYSLNFAGGQALAKGTLTLQSNDLTEASPVQLAALSVHILSQQVSPVTLQVTGPNGVSTSSTLPSNETASLFLPSGSYTVSASQGGNTVSSPVVLTDGNTSTVTLNFNTYLSLEIILVATAIMAGAANILFWLSRSRSLRARLASGQ